MARIKCKYLRYRCGDGRYEHEGQICKHHDYGWHMNEYDDGCGYADAGPYTDDDGKCHYTTYCRHVFPEEVIFEKEVKSFTYDYDGLEMRGLSIPSERIKGLWIDGERVDE